MGSKLSVVVGGQYGSESKGACAARLALNAADSEQMTVIRVAGPNAGHTAYDSEGRRWALRQIPVAAVTNRDCVLVIGPGSEIDFTVLLDEVNSLEAAGHPIRNRLIVDQSATMITDDHKELEAAGKLTEKLGSTAKGIGAARADRIMRSANTVRDAPQLFEGAGIRTEASTNRAVMINLRDSDEHVVIEGTQGYGLGLHTDSYPKCTSSDCRAIDFLSLAGIDPSWADEYTVWVVLRTYPIRVAGNSGDLPGETTWEELGFEPEKTTVTQKIRRVGEWDARMAADAVFENGGRGVVKISLSMSDYVVPQVRDIEGDFAEVVASVGIEAADQLSQLVAQVESDVDAPVAMVGTGPNSFVMTGI